MNEKDLRNMICQVLEERYSYDVVILNFIKTKNYIKDTFINVFNELGLSVINEDSEKVFYMPDKILYLSGASLADIIKIISSEENIYKNIRKISGEKIVFLDLYEDELLNNLKSKDELINSLKIILNELNINLISLDNFKTKNEVQNLTEKKFITISDLEISGPGEIVVNKDAKLTMALSEKLSSKKISIRRL